MCNSKWLGTAPSSTPRFTNITRRGSQKLPNFTIHTRWLESGNAGISATDYIRARRELEAQRRAAESVFEQVDVVITPTTAVAAPRISELALLGEPDLRDFETKYLLRNTAPFSVLYWPSVSVPCGLTPDGLPVGMQISGKPGADATVLRLANAYEEATDWHNKGIVTEICIPTGSPSG